MQRRRYHFSFWISSLYKLYIEDKFQGENKILFNAFDLSNEKSYLVIKNYLLSFSKFDSKLEF